MGNSSYSIENRNLRSAKMGYTSADFNDIFTQNKKHKVHELMDSKGITFRESRDSAEHPNSIPIIIALDVTGSMGHIPHHLIKEGLPNLVGGIIQNGIPDPQILFLAIGDHEVDSAPLQVGQFESGDEELDMWLTRTYVEGGGGGNGGESYGLAHYFASHYCHTDHWDKRVQKGILITIGDEPNLKNYPSRVFKEISNNGDIPTYTDVELVNKAKEKWNVFHIIPGREARSGTKDYWNELLGDNSIWVDSYTEIPQLIKDLVLNNNSTLQNNNKSSDNIKISL